MRILPLVFVALVSTAPSPAAAEFRSREVLLSECQADSGDPEYVNKRVACLAYISAVADAVNLQVQWGKTAFRFCLPDGITVTTLRDDVVTYMLSNQKLEGSPGSFNVLMALAARYPCRNQDDIPL